MPRLTVIGGSGFLGRSLIARCKGWSITSFDRVPFPPGLPHPLDFTAITGDTSDPALLDEACRASDVIWIRAGLTGGAKSVDASAITNYLAANTQMVHSVLQSAEKMGCSRILFDSSEQVWGISADRTRQDVGEEPVAGNFYGASKSISEKLLRQWSMAEGRSVQVFRYTRVRSADTRDVISHMVRSCLRGEPLRITVDPTHTISFVHIDDVLATNLIALNLTPRFAVYQVSCDRPYQLIEIAELVIGLTASRSEVLIEPAKSGLPFEPHITGMPWKECAAHLGYVPEHDLKSMIQETIDLVRMQQLGNAV